MNGAFRQPDQDLLSLLRSKNRCLERLLGATRTLLGQPVENLLIASAEATESDALTAFNLERESVLRALELYDRKVNELLPLLSAEMKTAELLSRVRTEMERNEKLIAEIFSADERVFERITEAQSRIQKLAAESRRSKEVIGKFKSTWVTESGEEMDKTL